MGSVTDYRRGANPAEKPQPVLEFSLVSGIDDPQNQLVQQLRAIFRDVLEPLYGDQTKALQKIAAGTDRACYLMTADGNVVGVLQFKTEATDEHEEIGVRRSVEIKSLFLSRPGPNAGRGLGSQLLRFLEEELRRREIDHNMLHLTVSEERVDSLLFFMKKGFSNVYQWKHKYKRGKYEFLMARRTPSSAPLLLV
eukprot:m.122422 g.122422  ORF g.122422 m.122422 type:complete len:195 (+) comp17274_c0_seq2:397-981(+)